MIPVEGQRPMTSFLMDNNLATLMNELIISNKYLDKNWPVVCAHCIINICIGDFIFIFFSG